MTRSNLHIILSDGNLIRCVADSSSAPEHGYMVEQFLLPLLSLANAEKEMELIREHCTMDEERINASYRYEIDLQNETVHFYEETYIPAKDKFKRGLELTGRYLSHLKKIETDTEKYCKQKFRHLSNKQLIDRANSLPDFKWDDEGVELRRRSLLSNGKFVYRMKRNTLIIINDED